MRPHIAGPQTGFLELDAWLLRQWIDNPEFKDMLKSMSQFLGTKDMSQNPQKNFLYSLMQKDAKVNGPVCMECSCYATFSKRFQKICDECFDSGIVGLQWSKDSASEHFVYYLLDTPLAGESRDRLVYIGVTKNPEQRYQDHFETKEFALMNIKFGSPDRKIAEEVETLLIALHRPVLNKAIPEINSVGHLAEKYEGTMQKLAAVDNYSK